MVYFSTTGSAEHELIDKVINAVKLANELKPHYKIDGEFQLDAAISPSVAAKKVNRPSEVAGKANIIIWPDLNVGNIGVKLLQQFAHADAYGPVLQGFRKVVCDCSRSAPLSELVGNIAISVVRAQGGGLLSLPGGTYEIDSVLLEHGRIGANGVTHPAQLGSQLAYEFCQQHGGRAFVVNPPDVDEYQDIARVTGIKDITRSSHLHALNQKETAIRHGQTLGKRYEECNFIVCHIGGGISVAAHKNGRMIDGTDIVEGEGPMAPTRAGAVPAAPLIRMCYSGSYTEKEMLAKCTKNGGLVDLTGTADAREICDKGLHGDRYAKLIWDAMIYQINKSIGAMAAVLHGNVDGILLGGGMVYNQDLVTQITEACSFIAPVVSYPGEFEMEAMASGAARVLEGLEAAKQYTGIATWRGFEE